MNDVAFNVRACSYAPLVTVLTPSYNRRKMLGDTLASVRLQTYPNVEHIVIDGGSTDGTLDLLRHAESAWGVRWTSGRDGGMYEALNHGLELARGSIVGWVNSDDWLLPWTVETVVEGMHRRPFPHAVFGDYLALGVGEDSARLQVYGQFNRRGLATVEALAQPTVFWPLSATQRLGQLDVGRYRQIADCEYWLRLSTELPFVKIREFLALGQDHPGTKRASLAHEITAEFAVLRAQYAPRRASRVAERVLSAARWRREWAALLTGNGWSRSLESELVGLYWRRQNPCRALLLYGPQRRHPPYLVRASVARLIELLRDTWAELEDGRPRENDHRPATAEVHATELRPESDALAHAKALDPLGPDIKTLEQEPARQ
jgi:Glycosyl transferase family 2